MERLILDCDTGQDDAIAILMAHGAKNLAVEGIVAVAGNTTLENALENTLKLTEDIDFNVPVYTGSRGPLIRKQIVASAIHGESGYDGPVFTKKRIKKSCGNGIDFIINTIMQNPGEINLVATGPLTDIAIAIKKEPKIITSVKRLIIMGGSLSKGNVTPSAEFNIYADPEAAKIVFNCGIEIYMMGLDVTKQTIVSKDFMQKCIVKQKEKPSRSRQVFIDGMNFYIASCMKAIREAPSMHDPCCIAFLINPSLFSFEKHLIDVETKGELTYGETVDLGINENSNIHVGIKVDTKQFFELLFQSLQ
ncbi:MAG: hypothetical protein BKP49_03700 [Treponema sp. CETP13]|nr:MAG: hypothetical protein BKP49_03700 [Treponema sp. CETP13]